MNLKTVLMKATNGSQVCDITEYIFVMNTIIETSGVACKYMFEK